jgi:hypothetical protein
MRRLAIIAIFLAVAMSTPAFACRSKPPPGDIEAALAESAGRLATQDIAKIQDLRQQAWQLQKDGKYDEARSANYQAMHIMGMTFVSNGPPTRSCGGGGQWLRKDAAAAR